MTEWHQERERERRAHVREMEERERHVQGQERQASQEAQQELATLRRDKANLQAALDAHTNLVCIQRQSSLARHLTTILTLSLCYYYLCKMAMEKFSRVEVGLERSECEEASRKKRVPRAGPLGPSQASAEGL